MQGVTALFIARFKTRYFRTRRSGRAPARDSGGHFQGDFSHTGLDPARLAGRGSCETRLRHISAPRRMSHEGEIIEMRWRGLAR